jgi:hypothetical protein
MSKKFTDLMNETIADDAILTEETMKLLEDYSKDWGAGFDDFDKHFTDILSQTDILLGNALQSIQFLNPADIKKAVNPTFENEKMYRAFIRTRLTAPIKAISNMINRMQDVNKAMARLRIMQNELEKTSNDYKDSFGRTIVKAGKSFVNYVSGITK